MGTGVNAVQPLEVSSTPFRADVCELRWSYVRGHQRQSCRLSLDARRRTYEFHVRDNASQPRERIERYAFACDVIERHCNYERTLLMAGYSLEAFEKHDGGDTR